MSYTSILFLTVLLFVIAVGIIFLVLVYQKKQLQYLNERGQMKAQYEKEILESRLEIQEQTMKNISQEVHDNIGQVLSVVKLNLAMMNGNEPKPVLMEKLNNTSHLVGKVIQDLRDLSKSLDSDAITEKGLVKAIEYEFELLKKTEAYATELRIAGESYSLPHQKELILFRIFQEAINNMIKHSGASRVEVSLAFHPGQFILQIEDNGKGFDNTKRDSSGGSGIRNIKNRSRLIGADCTLASGPANGALIKIELPVEEVNSVAQEQA